MGSLLGELGLSTGLLFLAASIVMVRMARPRYGLVVGFLRDRDWLQAIYTYALILLFVTGSALVLTGWH
jgi:hypothetical protein